MGASTNISRNKKSNAWVFQQKKLAQENVLLGFAVRLAMVGIHFQLFGMLTDFRFSAMFIDFRANSTTTKKLRPSLVHGSNPAEVFSQI